MEQAKIFYDVSPFMLSDLDSQKNQVIVFAMQQFKHIPLVAFCYEEIMENEPDKIMEYVEIYHPDLLLHRIGGQIYINGMIQAVMDAEGSGESSALRMFVVGEGGARQYFRQTRFNDFHYLEKNLSDRVDTLEDINKQVIEQIKQLKKVIKNNMSGGYMESEQ